MMRRRLRWTGALLVLWGCGVTELPVERTIAFRCLVSCGPGLDCVEQVCVLGDPALCRWSLPELD